MNKKHILTYLEYIKNIEITSNEDDFKIYNNIIKKSSFENLILVEGLIKTHPIQKSIEIIKHKFPHLIVKMEKEGEITIKGDMSNLKQYIPLFTNLGYFISAYINDEVDENGIKIDATYNVYDSDVTGIILEPKYDVLISPIPKILYHASPLKFKDKILKNGLSPRSGNKQSIHLDRIYLTDNLKMAIGFGGKLEEIPIEEMKINIGYCVYEIKGTGIQNLYSDINWRNEGFYTDHNIAPEYCKLIIEHKWNNKK